MRYVFPDYYKDFKCIADRCGHNCCIGWEIDIDSDTLSFYQQLSGDFGKRLRGNISKGDEPHFILGEGDRCPFLNDKNLCDIITTLGEEHLCGICADHPRFRNELPDRTEVGLGLCCEEAARLILSRRDKVSLSGAERTDDEIIILRDRMICALQQREKCIEERLSDVFALLGQPIPSFEIKAWCERLLRLERLDDAWGGLLCRLKSGIDSADFDGFDRFMAERQTEYEQLLVYIIYRHFANSPDLSEAVKRAAFAAFWFYLLRAMGAVIWSEEGEFSFAQQADLARMFSSEIEYSDENLYALTDSLGRCFM